MTVFYDRGLDFGDIDYGTPAVQRIQFQHGPVREGKPNGVTTEQVIELLVLRLRDLQKRLPCRENLLALTDLEQAEMWLERRTRLREEEGVEGTMEPHQP